jgi:hypothetical protein
MPECFKGLALKRRKFIEENDRFQLTEILEQSLKKLRETEDKTSTDAIWESHYLFSSLGQIFRLSFIQLSIVWFRIIFYSKSSLCWTKSLN